MVALDDKTKHIARKLPKYLGVALVIGIAVWFAVISPVLSRLEKNKFEAAYVNLQKVAEDLQNKAGKANTVENLKKCGYSGAKFSKGRLSCSVRIELNYDRLNLEESNAYLQKASALIESPLYPGMGTKGLTTFEDIDYFRQIVSQGFYYDDMYCQVEYEYIDTSKQNTKTPNTQDGLFVDMVCFEESRAAHYPVVEY